ncbi:MAG: hypothetical protein AB8B97_14280 [Granulosicoccus sp.]
MSRVINLRYLTGSWVSVALFSAAVSVPPAVHATESMIFGGGSHVHDSAVRFENSVRWIGTVLTDKEVIFTTHFNDGSRSEPDIVYSVFGQDDIKPLARVFGDNDLELLRFRNHVIDNVATGTRVDELEPAISARLKDNIDEELLFIYSGPGGYAQTSDEGSSVLLWDSNSLSSTQLQQLLKRHDRPTRFVFGQSHSGDFHRLAYDDLSSGLALSEVIHCGFTAQSAYGVAEVTAKYQNSNDYRDYLSYFFSALSGYEYDGQIISRFADLNEDGQTSLREAHLYALEEAISIDLPLSTSEDYLLRWQPWYLRWQPAQKALPNNEYTRVFRRLANRLDIPLDDTTVRVIRNRIATDITQKQSLEQRLAEEQADIIRLQKNLQKRLIARWPALANPYSQGYQNLINDGKLPLISSFSEQLQPQYDKLTTRQTQTVNTRSEHLEKRRDAAQLQKLLQLRHLALLKQQLVQYGTEQQIINYRSLLRCEQKPLAPSSPATIVSEETTQ